MPRRPPPRNHCERPTTSRPWVALTLTANKQLQSAAEYADLIVSVKGGNPVRLRDVANVQDSFETVRTAGSFNGERAIFVQVQRQTDANQPGHQQKLVVQRAGDCIG